MYNTTSGANGPLCLTSKPSFGRLSVPTATATGCGAGNSCKLGACDPDRRHQDGTPSRRACGSVGPWWLSGPITDRAGRDGPRMPGRLFPFLVPTARWNDPRWSVGGGLLGWVGPACSGGSGLVAGRVGTLPEGAESGGPAG